jgi:inorganic pyrophosphatase
LWYFAHNQLWFEKKIKVIVRSVLELKSNHIDNLRNFEKYRKNTITNFNAYLKIICVVASFLFFS